MATAGVCSEVLEGLGYGGCLTGPLLRAPKRPVLAIESQQFSTQAEAKTKLGWITDLIGKELFPLGIVDDAEDKSTEDSVPVTAFGRPVFQKAGRNGFKVMMLLTPDQNRILQSYNDKKVRLYVIMDGNNIIGTTNGTVVKGLKLSYFHASTIKMPVTLDGFAYSTVEFQLESVDELNSNPFYILGSECATAAIPWYPADDIVPMTKITLTPGDHVVTNAFTCAFAYVDPTTGLSVPMRGVVAADIQVKDQTGAVEVIVSVVETATLGTYTITATSMTSGSIEMIASADSLFYSDVTVVTA